MGFMCFVCKKMFSRQFNLNKHTKKVHNLKPKIVSYDQSKWNCLENDCNSSFQHNIGLRTHLSKDHNIQMQTETIEFSKREEFLAWKNVIEKTEKSNYIVARTSKLKDKSVTYYLCNRSGKIRSKIGNKRLPKAQGSCKLNRHCISMIRVIEADRVLVTWMKTHYGHNLDLQHIRLPKIDKSAVASKLTLGVSAARILDSYRDQIDDKDINREDLISRKDIQNIKNAYHINISEGVKHDNDAISVDLWVEQCKQDQPNPILFYKKQGVEDEVYKLCSIDFCLVIMTNFQKNMFKKFGDNIVAIDGTHGLNNYDFELSTILVVDEFGEGIPVAFMFTNRKDTYIYEIFFNVIKLNAGVLNPKTFMSDIVSTFYSAWCCIMGPVVHQLFCSWHIDRAWQQNLSKIGDKNKRSEVYKSIKFLQQNTSTDEFCEFLQRTISQMLSDADTQNFAVYFQNNYGTNYEKWAYCFRKGCGINTNMRVESMHKTLKYFYLDGKKVKRLDKTLHVLIKYVRDKCVDRLIKRIKGKHTIHVKQIITRHITAASSQFTVVPDKENSNIWFINPESQETYCVQKLLEQSCCDLMCKECNICFHTYSCTCNDFCIANSICKHIHYIEIKCYPKTVLPEAELLSNQENDCEIKSTHVKKFDHLKENVSAKIISTMSKLQNADKNKLDEEVILQIQCHLDTIDKLLDLPCTSTQSFTPITHNEPQIKKIRKQDRFFSTQKKKKVNRSNCKKPTHSEIVKIDKDIKSNFCELYISHSSTQDHNYL